MSRILASIQKINNITPIENADTLEIAHVLGWEVVVKKGKHQIGELIVFFEIDSFLPAWDQYEFLKSSSWNKQKERYRLKTIKLRGQISQGLVMPILDLFAFEEGLFEGCDVTEPLDVIKYEKEEKGAGMGGSKGDFPHEIPKTDQGRVQNMDHNLETYKNDTYLITTKLDGSSATFYNGKVYSKNFEREVCEDNIWGLIALKYPELLTLPSNLAVQGEIIGPGINGGRQKVSEIEFYVFGIYDVNLRRHLIEDEKDNIYDKCDIPCPHVPMIGLWKFDQPKTSKENIQDLIELSNRTCGVSEELAEGIVLWNQDRDFSFKVINPNYLLKHGE